MTGIKIGTGGTGGQTVGGPTTRGPACGWVLACVAVVALGGCAGRLPPRAGTAAARAYQSRFTRENARIAYRPGNYSNYLSDRARQPAAGALAASEPPVAAPSPAAAAILRSVAAASPPAPVPVPRSRPAPPPVTWRPTLVRPPAAAPVVVRPVRIPPPLAAAGAARPRPASPAPAVLPSVGSVDLDRLRREENRLVNHLAGLKDERRALVRISVALSGYTSRPGAAARTKFVESFETYMGVRSGEVRSHAAVQSAIGDMRRGNVDGALRGAERLSRGVRADEDEIRRVISQLTDRRRSLVRLETSVKTLRSEPTAVHRESYAKALDQYERLRR